MQQIQANYDEFISACLMPYHKTGYQNEDGLDLFTDEDKNYYIFDSTTETFLYAEQGFLSDWHYYNDEGVEVVITSEKEIATPLEGYMYNNAYEVIFGSGKYTTAGTGTVIIKTAQSALKVIGGVSKGVLGKLQTTKFSVLFKLKKAGVIKYATKAGGQIGMSITAGTLLSTLLTIKTAKEVATFALTAQSLALFADFICEEAIQTAGMAVYIAKGRDVETLRISVDNYKMVLEMAEGVHVIAQFNLAKPAFDAFFVSARNNIPVYESLLIEAEKAEAQKIMKYEKDAALVFVYTEKSTKIFVDGIFRAYAPAMIRVNKGTHNIKLEKPGFISYTETVFLEPYMIKKIGEEDNPIILKEGEETITALEIQEIKTSITATLTGKCVEVSDGDTITIRTPPESQSEYTEYSIRLYGIDAYEIGHGAGKSSDWGSGQIKNLLSWMIEKEIINVKVYDVDKYGRIVGEIFLRDENINLSLVRMGAVRVYYSYLNVNALEYQNAETEAKTEGRGIWKYGTRPKITMLNEIYEAKNIPIPETTTTTPMKTQTKGTLEIYSTEAYTVFVNMIKQYQSSPCKIKLAEGEYLIELKKWDNKMQAYNRAEEFMITVKAGETVRIGSVEKPITLK